MQKERYNHLNTFFKNKFGERVLKICIDGNFTCPNRDGKCGTGGCVFCSENGSGKNRTTDSISTQIHKHLESYRGQRANKFIAYFQNFTNTYADALSLKQKYEEALSASDKIIGLSIATRPDCIDDEIASLLEDFSKKCYIQVELGLQSSNDTTAKIINRGYNSSLFTKAVKLLNKHNIDVVVHIMVGLPNENIIDVLKTIDFVNKQKISGIKIHSTYVIEKTKLCDMYYNGQYTPLSLEEYKKALIEIITHLRQDIIIHRISGDPPKENLVAPDWSNHKKLILNGIERELKEKDLWQGKFYK